jgi:hypothetical protein
MRKPVAVHCHLLEFWAEASEIRMQDCQVVVAGAEHFEILELAQHTRVEHHNLVVVQIQLLHARALVSL